MGCGESKSDAVVDAGDVRLQEGAHPPSSATTSSSTAESKTDAVDAGDVRVQEGGNPPSSANTSSSTAVTTHGDKEGAWTPIVERWAAEPPDADEGATPPPAEEALVEAAAACLEAGKSAPCLHCGNVFAEQWGDKPWHCFGCKTPLDTVRAAPEEAAKAAVVAVDAPFVITRGGGLTAAGEKRHAARGVCVRFLLRLLASLPAAVRRTVTTGDMVAHLIKPATRRSRCRFVELPAMRAHVGQPRAFVSHVWSALFADLVAAIAHAIPEDAYVWVDILCAAALSPNLGPVGILAAHRRPLCADPNGRHPTC